MKTVYFTISLVGSLLISNTFKLQSAPTLSPITLSSENENTGKETFENECASCHTGGFKGFMSGAPDIDDTEDWEKSKEKELSVLTKDIIEGTKRHEAKGGCEDCSNEEIKAAIEYILSKN